MSKTCDLCGGSGVVATHPPDGWVDDFEFEPCVECGGTGRMKEEEESDADKNIHADLGG